ncbi:MAG TPA: SWIM zinc finger family protein, partial [Thermomicrobiales bacterium]|nr:SWIM zinc finger family protein [Thermomicrobiales bacterium]
MARAHPSEPAAAPAEAADAFLPLTAEQIAQQTDSGSFSRGKTYFRGGRIFAPLRRGALIQAQCHGSSGGPYRVEATLAIAGGKRRKNPVAYACDCPRGGFCKHVVALLLTWIDAPERFTARPPIADILAGKSQEELIALIELMVREEPDFEALLDLPIPVGGVLSAAPIDEAALRRQIEAAFAAQQTGRYGRGRRSGWYEYDDWESTSHIAGNLQQLIDLAQGYADADDWRNAVAVLAVISEMTIPHLSRFADPNGDLFTIVGECDRRLAEGLDAQAEAPEEDRLTPAERLRLIDALLAN